MRNFELVHPATLAEAIDLLASGDDATRAFSGGTALMLMLKSGLYQPGRFIHLGAIEARHSAIEATADGGVMIGAMATLASLERAPAILRRAPVVSNAMKHLANVRVRNVARVGGALAHGDPHMDLPPMLASLGGEAMVAGPKGQRRIAIQSLYTGYYETALEPGELIIGARLPDQRGWSSAYIKCVTRAADDWPTVGVAVSLRMDSGAIADARIMIGAATERLARLDAAEAALRNAAPGAAAFERAAEAGAAEAETVGSATGSAAYKTDLLRVYIRRALVKAIENEAAQ